MNGSNEVGRLLVIGEEGEGDEGGGLSSAGEEGDELGLILGSEALGTVEHSAKAWLRVAESCSGSRKEGGRTISNLAGPAFSPFDDML